MSADTETAPPYWPYLTPINVLPGEAIVRDLWRNTRNSDDRDVLKKLIREYWDNDAIAPDTKNKAEKIIENYLIKIRKKPAQNTRVFSEKIDTILIDLTASVDAVAEALGDVGASQDSWRDDNDEYFGRGDYAKSGPLKSSKKERAQKVLNNMDKARYNIAYFTEHAKYLNDTFCGGELADVIADQVARGPKLPPLVYTAPSPPQNGRTSNTSALRIDTALSGVALKTRIDGDDHAEDVESVVDPHEAVLGGHGLGGAAPAGHGLPAARPQRRERAKPLRRMHR